MTEQLGEHRVGDRVRIGQGHVLWVIVELYSMPMMAKVRNNYIGAGGMEQYRTIALERLTNISAQRRKES